MLSSALCVSALLVVNVVLSQAAVPPIYASTEDREVQKQIVDKTNEYRRKVQQTTRSKPEGAKVKPTCASTDDPKVQQQIVDKINEYRRKVQPPARNMLEVSWSEEAAKNAAKWAKTCSFQHSKPYQRNITKYECGENLYMASPVGSWDEGFKAFDDEKELFVYGEEPKTGVKVGHYTQQCWYNSRLIGCACAHCPGKEFEFFYVCQMCPAGNVNSLAKPYAEGPTCADCPNHCNNGLCTNPCTEKHEYTNCKQLAEKYCYMPNIMDKCAAYCICKDQII